jgi:hypothetical protein
MADKDMMPLRSLNSAVGAGEKKALVCLAMAWTYWPLMTGDGRRRCLAAMTRLSRGLGEDVVTREDVFEEITVAVMRDFFTLRPKLADDARLRVDEDLESWLETVVDKEVFYD